jgi:hypothetical protein
MATGWMFRESNPGGGEIFRIRPNRPWDPPSLVSNAYRFRFPGVKRPGCGIKHPPQSNAEVKDKVDLYLCSPSRPTWPLWGQIFCLPCLQQPTSLYFICKCGTKLCDYYLFIDNVSIPDLGYYLLYVVKNEIERMWKEAIVTQMRCSVAGLSCTRSE